MKTLLLLISVVFLFGCTTSQVMSGCKEGERCINYAQVSEGEASGISVVVGGAGATCKVTTYGDPEGWRVKYKGVKCDAEFGEEIDEE